MNKYKLGLKYLDLDYKVIFIFNFEDELTFYELDHKHIFKDKWIFRKDIKQRKLHKEIPIKLLTTIKKY